MLHMPRYQKASGRLHRGARYVYIYGWLWLRVWMCDDVALRPCLGVGLQPPEEAADSTCMRVSVHGGAGPHTVMAVVLNYYVAARWAVAMARMVQNAFVMLTGEEHAYCQALIEAHKACLRVEGFKVSELRWPVMHVLHVPERVPASAICLFEAGRGQAAAASGMCAGITYSAA